MRYVIGEHIKGCIVVSVFTASRCANAVRHIECNVKVLPASVASQILRMEFWNMGMGKQAHRVVQKVSFGSQHIVCVSNGHKDSRGT